MKDLQQQTNEKRINLKNACAALALGALLMVGLQQAQARSDFNNWQPAIGALNQEEDYLNARMNRDYKKGLIDWDEMAQMRRDLDGIQCQADEFRMDHNGLGTHDVNCVLNKLNRFEQNLDRAEKDKAPQILIVFRK